MKIYIDKKDDYKISIWLCLVFAYYVYSFTLLKWTYLGYLVTYLIPIVYIILNSRKLLESFKVISLRSFLVIAFYIILFCMSVFLPIAYATNDFSYIKTLTYIIRKGIIYIFLAMLIMKKYKKNCAEVYIMYYSISTLLYVCVTIVFVMFPQIKNSWFQFVLADSQKGLYDSFGYTFRLGWMGFSGFQATLKCTISVIFMLYLLSQKDLDNKGFRKKGMLILCLLASLLGNAFYGRVGLLCSALIIIFFIISSKTFTLKRLLFFGGLILLILVVLFFIKDRYLIVNEWYVWMITPFKNLIQSGEFDNASVSELKNNMIFMPKLKTFLLGDAKYTTLAGGYYMETDSGFMRQLLFWGIIGMVLCYSMLLFCLPKIRKENKYLIWPLLFSFIIFEIKGEAYYDFVPIFITIKMLNKYSTIRMEYNR